MLKVLSSFLERRNSEQIDHEDKDNEDSDKAQYHPRCFLFSGPPQVGSMIHPSRQNRWKSSL